MKRREYLRLTGGLVGASATAGCVSTLGGGGATSAEETYLSPPEETGLNVDHPTYGDPIPEAEMLDVFTDEQVSTDQDTEFLMTFFFTFCPTECLWLISSMTHAEARILEKGLDRPRVLAATFDPARDTLERMRDYAERMGIDAGNWSFLRPEDEETAEAVITGEFGVNFRKATEETEAGVYDFLHTTLILLVNEDGYVERTYRNDDPDPVQERRPGPRRDSERLGGSHRGTKDRGSLTCGRRRSHYHVHRLKVILLSRSIELPPTPSNFPTNSSARSRSAKGIGLRPAGISTLSGSATKT